MLCVNYLHDQENIQMSVVGSSENVERILNFCPSIDQFSNDCQIRILNRVIMSGAIFQISPKEKDIGEMYQVSGEATLWDHFDQSYNCKIHRENLSYLENQCGGAPSCLENYPWLELV